MVACCRCHTRCPSSADRAPGAPKNERLITVHCKRLRKRSVAQIRICIRSVFVRSESSVKTATLLQWIMVLASRLVFLGLSGDSSFLFHQPILTLTCPLFGIRCRNCGLHCHCWACCIACWNVPRRLLTGELLQHTSRARSFRKF